MLHRWAAGAHSFVFGPVDPVRMSVFKRIYAFALLLYMANRAMNPYEWLTDWGYHPSPAAEYTFYPPPLPLLPAWAVPWFLAVFLGSLVALVLNFRARAANWIALAGLIYVSFADITAAFSLNKMFTVGLSITALAPSPVTVVSGGEKVLRVSAWPLRVGQATFIIWMWSTGMCKAIHGDWIAIGGMVIDHDWSRWAPLSTWFKGNQDMLWFYAHGWYRTEIAAFLLRVLPKPVWAVMQYGALVFELFTPLLFMVRRLRPLAIVWGLCFQVVIALTMRKVGYFNLMAVCWFVLFVDPRLLHAAGRWITTAAQRIGIGRSGRAATS